MNVDKIARFINNSKVTQKVLRAVSDNPALASAGVSFVAASILRPSAQGLRHGMACRCRSRLQHRRRSADYPNLPRS